MNGTGWGGGDAMNVKHNTTGGIEGQGREGENERMSKEEGMDEGRGKERRGERMSECVCATRGCRA